MDDVTNRRIVDGQYEFSYKGQTIIANRQPDLYFVIEFNGQRHKNYLKNLKALWKAHLDGLSPEAVGVTEEPKATPKVEAPAPPKPISTAKYPGFRTGKLRANGYDVRAQKEIDDCKDRSEQIKLWCTAYNMETASMAVTMMPRHVFVLPPGPEPEPKLTNCYNQKSDRYSWPTQYCNREE